MSESVILPKGDEQTDDWTVVWIDSREAIIVTWAGAGPDVQRLRSEVPPHRASTGHVRHDPMVRHGGGGGKQEAGESDRHEHLARFLDQVALRIGEDHEVLILGPGVVHQQLARQLHEADIHHGRVRLVRFETSPRRTSRQLIAKMRELRGTPARRRTVGAYRWTGLQPERPSGQKQPPRRVVEKPSIDEFVRRSSRSA